METGYDIIFFWVARMMMLGLHLTDASRSTRSTCPGSSATRTARRCRRRRATSSTRSAPSTKSGADALRFALIHGTTPGNDQRFGPAKLENARNFANKLWNATRFVLGRPPGDRSPTAPSGACPDARHLGPAERWLLSRAAATTEAVDAAMADYAFGEVTRLLYDAIWNEYCDWGLEFAKVRLADERSPPEEREATWWTLVEVLDTYLRLLHPVMPFVTEALWAALPHRADGPGAADRRALARGGGARPRRRARGRDAHRARRRDPQRARRGEAPGRATGCETLVYVPVELGPTFEALRPAIERLARARPLHRELTPEALEAAAAARATSRSSSPAARSRRPSGPRRPTPTPTPSSATGWSASSPRPRAGWRPPASASPNDVVRHARAGRGRRGRPRPRSRARRPGRPVARANAALTAADGANAPAAGPRACLSTVLTKPQARNIRLCQVSCQSPARQGTTWSRSEECPPG